MKKMTTVLVTCLIAGAVGAADIVHQQIGTIAFKTTRLSSNESNYLKLPVAWAESYGSFNKSLKLPPQTAEMVRLRVGQMDRCDYCTVFHTRDALAAGVEPAKVSSIANWRSSGAFSDKERAALAYAEALSSLDQGAISAAYQQLDTVGYSAVQKEELTNVTILMNVWSRIFLAQGKQSYIEAGANPAGAAKKP